MSEAFPGQPEAPEPTEPRVAAAVILWREGPVGREIFWVRRAEPLQFAGGFHAFPGGRLDEADERVAVAGLAGNEAALVACACRELFEETGVLLARGAARLSRHVRDTARRALLDDSLEFAVFLAENGLALDPEVLAPAGRWITPPFVPLRYDAHLFLAHALPHEEAAVWPGELAGGEFIPASRALALWEHGEALLHPPNLWGIGCLARAAPPGVLELLRSPPHCQDFVTWRVEFQKGVWMVPLRTPTLPPATHTNTYLLDVGGSLAVIDPGSPRPEEQSRLRDILATLAEEGHPASEVWLTHHHADHVGGLGALAALGLPIRAHPLTASRLPGGLPVLPLADGDLLHGRFRVLHTPGHARGHVCFLDERTGALVCGDMVSTLSTIVIDPPEGQMAEYVRQLERLRALGPRTLYPAHGMPAPRGLAKLTEYIDHRSAREERIVAALEGRGTLLSDIARIAYADTPDAFLPLAERSCLAGLEKLRAEGRAHERNGLWTL